MRKIINRLRTRAEEKGAVLPFVALVLVVLMGMAAFAIDLGWLYLQGSRIQRGADASALAGVVHLPGNIGQVNAQTVNGANANGWNVGELNGNDIGAGADALDWEQLADNRLQVELTSTVNTFFMRVFGINEITMTRRATAEYIKPVPIGSPFSSFGDGNDDDQGFWAAISGPYTARTNGDAFQSMCDWSNVLGTCRDSSVANRDLYWSGATIYPNDIDANDYAENTGPGTSVSIYRPGGYYYGIEVTDTSGNLTVQMYDPGFRRRQGSGGGCTMSVETGDCDRLVWGPSIGTTNGTQGPTTHYQLYAPDSTPLDPTDNLPIAACYREFAAYQPNVTPPGSWGLNSWVNLCPQFTPTPGIYVLRVWTSSGSGSNHYGIRAQTTGTTPAKVYGINDISIFANANNADLYLAMVDPSHAGKTLELRFYDAGEGAGNAFMTVLMPNGDTADCIWEARDQDNGLIDSQTSFDECEIQTTSAGVALYNNAWITAQVRIPNSYSCTPTGLGCWWKMNMQLNTPHDRTTWTARIIGNPVRLVPN